MNNNSESKECARKNDTTKRFGGRAAKEIRADLLACGAVMALMLLSGCASVSAELNADPNQYNLKTEYPVVGAMPWRL